MTNLQQGKQNQKKDDFLVQGAILAVASVVVKIIGVLYRIPLTNILGDEGNGFYGYAYEVYALALMLSTFSLPMAVSKLVSARLAKRQARNAFRVFLCSLVFSIGVGLVVALFIFFGAQAVAVHMMDAPLSVYALRVLAVGIFVVALLGVFRGYFQGLGTMVPTAVSQIIEQAVNAIVSIIGAYFLFQMGTKVGKKTGESLLGSAYGAAGGTLGTVVGAALALLFLLFVFYAYSSVMRRQLGRDRTPSVESFSSILKILLLTMAPILCTTAIYNVNQLLDLTIFNKIMAAQGSLVEEYMALQGIYTGKYNTLINVPLAMANGLAAAVLPSLTASMEAGRSKEIVHQKIARTIRLTMLIALPCFIGFVVLAKPIMMLLFHDDSDLAAALLALGAITVVSYCLATVMNSILQGINQLFWPTVSAGISLVIHLIALLIMLGVFHWSIYALVVSNVVFSFCMCWLNARGLRKVCGYRQEWRNTFLKPLLAALIMGIAALGTYSIFRGLLGSSVATILALLVAVIVYAVGIFKCKVLSGEDLRSLPHGEKLCRICTTLHLL